MKHSSNQPSNLYSLQDESLKLLTSVFDIKKASSYLVDKHSNLVCFKNYHVQPGMHREYMAGLYQFDPSHPSNLNDQNVSILRTNELVSLVDRPDHPYYTNFMRPWGIQDTIEIYLRSEEHIVAGFSLFVGTDQSDLLSRDMKKLAGVHDFMQFSLDQCLTSPEQESFDSFCDNYKLTAKERMVVEQVLQGLPNKSISNNLCCSVATVKTHLQHIFAKLQVNSKAEIASLLYQKKAWH